ncbi:Nickel-binding periplasmic protein precursor [Vibrio ruber DSM 16370]|uniref:Nickel-binding periplasmic protein n=1 Tax=Vibrio ruber (strain DSM 16370 / JCM 11486 / BCRC 17186 / CECT 7878 / LMG 23124 / VR1) TaxID=1123498 RepID=A0A1R4LSD3_VIBR1|nr:ABC transporter substrate-binding protein [Vibrio ruber]SJN59299.1 Nickel-binding periplasmic protein precursor [Vibrio ruber DSM 16370]
MKKILLIIVVGIIAIAIYQHRQSQNNTQLTISGPFEFNGTELSRDGFLYSRLGVTESLTRLMPDGSVQPLLATEWTPSADGLIWRFSIRPGVVFHDGSQLNAEAVRQNLAYARTQPGVIRQVPIQAITVENGTLVIALSRPYSPLLSVLAHYSLGMVSPATLGKIAQGDETDKGQAPSAVIGTGAYQVAMAHPPHKIEVTQNPDYWGEPAHIQSVSYLAGHRSESRALLVRSGQADIAYSVDPISREGLKQSEQVSVQSLALPRTVLLKLNLGHPQLRHLAVRQAISLALDREGMASTVLRLPGSAAYQLFSPSQSDWYLDNLHEQRNLQKAKTLMMQQGWSYDNQGWLVRDGQPFTLTLTTYANRPELPVLATSIQNQLALLGIQVNVSIDNASAIPAKHHDNTLDMALIARNFGMMGTPLPILYDDFSSPQGSDWGHMNWDSPQIRAILTQLLSESDPHVARQLSQQVARIMADQLPVIPIAYSQQLIAVNNRVSGFSFDPYEIDYRLKEMQLHD